MYSSSARDPHHQAEVEKPLSVRRLSNIEQYKQRAAQKRQERIQGGGLAKQSLTGTLTHIGSGKQNARPTLQPVPPSNYKNPLSQQYRNKQALQPQPQQHQGVGFGGGRKHHQSREREPLRGDAGSAATRAAPTTATVTGTTGTWAEPTATIPARDRSDAPSVVIRRDPTPPLKIFQDVKDRTRSSFKSDTEQQLQAQGITPVYEPKAHREKQEEDNFDRAENPRHVVTDITDRRLFLVSPGPRRDHVKCTIRRERGTFGMFPKYTLWLDGPTGMFLLSARKRKKSSTSNYLISLDKDDLARQSGNYFGKLRSNFIGTEFVIFDKGSSPSDTSTKGIQPNVRCELGAVSYQHNVLGTRGPRKMTVVVPAINEQTLKPKRRFEDQNQQGESITDVLKETNGDSDDIIVYQNKSPTWNDQLGAFCLNFHGQVTEASVKNFQLVTSDDSDDVICQFGKVSDSTFSMDYKWPMSCLQAFAICLSSFDGKLACE